MELRPKKFLGQHFLRDENILQKIISVAQLEKNDTVLEIGPGTGILTGALAVRAKKVLAIEKDRELSKHLKKKFKNTNVEIMSADILKFDPEKFGLKKNNYKIVANIPYYITGKLIRNILEEWPEPKLIVLMLQKEVAQRITAAPPKMSLLAVAAQFYATARIVNIVPRSSFAPRPKIDSAIIKLIPREKILPAEKRKLFFEVLRAGFRQPRKTLVSNLQNYLSPKIERAELVKILAELNFSEKTRPAELSVDDWINLLKKSKILCSRRA